MAISGSRYQAAIDELRTRLLALIAAVEDADDLAEPYLGLELDRARSLLEAHTAGRKP